MINLAMLAILLFSVMLHEVAHGYIAYRLGDNTAKLSGRLNLNPLKHIDPLGSVVLPLMLLLSGSRVLFGWAKPVPVNENNFVNPRRDMMWCSLAGPLTNFTIATLTSLILKSFNLTPFWVYVMGNIIGINLILGTFNLIPIPPLDGSRVLANFLSGKLLYKYYRLEPYGILIIFVLLYLGILDYILQLFNPFFRLFF